MMFFTMQKNGEMGGGWLNVEDVPESCVSSDATDWVPGVNCQY